jgi:lysophospholipase L1-like esterase
VSDQQPHTWVAVGDSFTSGVGDYPTANGWVARAARRLRTDGIKLDLVNRAEPGVTVDVVLERQSVLLPAHASIVSAIAGANDLLGYSYKPARLERHLFELLERAAQASTLMLTSTCPDFFAHRYGRASKLTRRVEALNSAVHAFVARDPRRLLLLDTHLLLQDELMWHRDGIHPNPLGHRRLAQVAVDLLRPHLPLACPAAAASAG